MLFHYHNKIRLPVRRVLIIARISAFVKSSYRLFPGCQKHGKIVMFFPPQKLDFNQTYDKI